jgi:DNA-binding PadR family transcriptional regulator
VSRKPRSAGPKASPEAFLPLNQTVFRALLVLGDEEMHGYGIMRAVDDKTEGREKVLPGTLYACISRMLDDGLLEESDAPADDASGGPKRRYYRRTQLGKAVARAESERMRALVDLARAEKILPGASR